MKPGGGSPQVLPAPAPAAAQTTTSGNNNNTNSSSSNSGGGVGMSVHSRTGSKGIEETDVKRRASYIATPSRRKVCV